MGNNRKFKFSEMLPNAWFYKLKEMGNRNKHQQSRRKSAPPQDPPLKETHPHQDLVSHTRKSYYFTRDLNPTIDPPRKSSKKTRPSTKKRLSFTPTPTSTTKSSSSSSSSSSAGAGDEPCIVIDIDSTSLSRKTEDSVSTAQLPPIRTDRKKFNGSVKQIGGAIEEFSHEPVKKTKKSVRNDSFPPKVAAEEEESLDSSVYREQGIRPHRRISPGSPGFRIRVNSPRIARRVQVNTSKRNSSGKSMSSESLAIVKSSSDPKGDFRNSMVEMIIENNIRASKDLEELLACYLSLNSDEYHEVIIQVFKQIWFDLNKIRGG